VPRAIIDTQTSRPAFVRRRIGQAVALVALIALVAVGLFFRLNHAPGPFGAPAKSTPSSGSSAHIPGNSPG
jgi:uncharacterized membrane protein